MIAIIDYGTGNLKSVAKAFQFLGHSVTTTSEADEVSKCNKLILPGVGAFGDCMTFLKKKGLDKVINEWIANGKPYLGICLGMQVLFESSTEHGVNQGLGIIEGTVERFSGDTKVPQIGWNEVRFNIEASIKPENGYYYFVHSYYCKPADASVVWAKTVYGQEYCSAVARDNILAVQFHPEKSSKIGLDLLDKFAKSN